MKAKAKTWHSEGICKNGTGIIHTTWLWELATQRKIPEVYTNMLPLEFLQHSYLGLLAYVTSIAFLTVSHFLALDAGQHLLGALSHILWVDHKMGL
jgi:hypothetical protein